MTILVLLYWYRAPIAKPSLNVTYSFNTCQRMVMRIKLILPDLSLLAIWNFEKQIWDFRDNMMLHITKSAAKCSSKQKENLVLALFWYFVWPQKLCLDLYWSHLSFYLIPEKKNRKCFSSTSLKRGEEKKGREKSQKGSWWRQLQIDPSVWVQATQAETGGCCPNFYAWIFPWFHQLLFLGQKSDLLPFWSKFWPKTG